MFLYREKYYRSVNMHNYMSNYMIIICWKTNGNYMFPISAVAVVLWKIFHQCLRSWIILRNFAPFLVTNFVPFRVAFYPNRMHSLDRFRYTFLDKNKRSFYSVYWFSESYAPCSPRLSSTKTRIKTRFSGYVSPYKIISETIFH